MMKNYMNSVLERLLEGNQRFKNKMSAQSAPSQGPVACVITCVDSRVSPELLFQQEVGDLFVIRTPAALITPTVLASIHMSIEVMNIKNVIYIPHMDCRAIFLCQHSKETAKNKDFKNLLDQLDDYIDFEIKPDEDEISYMKKYAKKGMKLLKDSLKVHSDVQVTPMIYDYQTYQMSVLEDCLD